jgi:hypothetical protein
MNGGQTPYNVHNYLLIYMIEFLKSFGRTCVSINILKFDLILALETI